MEEDVVKIIEERITELEKAVLALAKVSGKWSVDMVAEIHAAGGFLSEWLHKVETKAKQVEQSLGITGTG